MSKNVVRLLTSETASVQTAAVEIKTLTVSGKQLTLAVFRQLLEEDIIDYKNIKLNGTPWGFVQYLNDYRHEDAIHIIWQKGNELRRCIIKKKPDFIVDISSHRFDLKSTQESSSIGITTTFSEFLADKSYKIIKKYIKRNLPPYPQEEWKGTRFIPGISRDPNYEEKMEIYLKAKSEYDSLIDKQEKQFEIEKQKIVELLQDEVNLRIAANIKFHNEYTNLVAPLWNLPQLFIAV